MKSIGFFLIVMGLFGAYVTNGLINQDGYLQGGITGDNSREVISKIEDPDGYKSSKMIAGFFTFSCFAGGIYLLRRKK